MKAWESEYREFSRYFRECTCEENDIMKPIMDFKMVHMRLVFGGLPAREFIALGIIKAYGEYIETLKKKPGGREKRGVTEYDYDTEKETYDKADTDRGLNVSVLACCLEISMPQVSRLLNSMEDKGYIVRSMNRQDRRVTYVKMTEYGKSVSESAVKEYKDYMSKVTATMGEERLITLIHLLNELNQIMLQSYED